MRRCGMEAQLPFSNETLIKPVQAVGDAQSVRKPAVALAASSPTLLLGHLYPHIRRLDELDLAHENRGLFERGWQWLVHIVIRKPLGVMLDCKMGDSLDDFRSSQNLGA